MDPYSILIPFMYLLAASLSLITLLVVTWNPIITEELEILKLHYFLKICNHYHIAVNVTILLLNAISWAWLTNVLY